MNATNSTILLVEDSENDADTLKRTLKKAKIANPLEVVTDGREAMAYLSGDGRFADRARFPLPFLVLLDLKLPKRDGFEVLQWMRGQSQLADIPVIVLTVSNDGSDHQRAYALGARSYLVKPPGIEELQRVMNQMQIYWSRFGDKGPGLPS